MSGPEPQVNLRLKCVATSVRVLDKKTLQRLLAITL